ncbi:hypothetical protein SUGI_0076590 [Cryptomeria japonica]|nr:hypothetical protein SUGI_0076590 [Cryptomeria japonica]
MGKHRKWQDIMVLEVQDAGEGLHHFFSRDIQWTPICAKNDSTTDLCAAIPLSRLDTFIRGESLHEEGADRPFIMGIQTSWMLDMMVRFSHDKYGYQLYSCLIFDEKQSRAPVAWDVTSRKKIKDIQVWLMELQRRAKEKRPNWTINAFIMNDASAEIHMIE